MILHTISNKFIDITFSEDPFSILEIKNKKTEKKFCINGKQTVLIRVPDRVSEPVILTRPESFYADSSTIKFTLTDEENRYKADFSISDSVDGVKFSMSTEYDEPIWMAEWKLSGLQFDEVIVPALGGQVLTNDMVPETILSYKYPFWWNAQFVIGALGDDGIWFRMKDPEPNMKLLRVRKGKKKEFTFTLGFEAKAPLTSKRIDAEWYMDGFENSWKSVVDIHRNWLEETFSLVSLNENPHFPSWTSEINFILEIWGMRKDDPKPHHTFKEMIERLNEWSKIYDPYKTLLYLPGFAEHGIDSHAPDYNPSIACGGEVEFKKLIDTAHELGFKVMIHTNCLAMTLNHPLYQKYKDHQVVDVFGRKQGWAMDIDGDWLPEEFFAYINPGVKEWNELMEEVIGGLINKFKIDAVFLDQTLLAFNVSKGPNFMKGMSSHINHLQRAFPEILFAGEGLHEQVLKVLPFAQIHGIDSIADVHGMEGKKKWRRVHPVSSYLFSKYTRFTAHLLTKHPSHPMFKLQEAAYKELNVIPALCLYDKEQEIDLVEVNAMIRRAKVLDENRTSFLSAQKKID